MQAILNFFENLKNLNSHTHFYSKSKTSNVSFWILLILFSNGISAQKVTCSYPSGSTLCNTYRNFVPTITISNPISTNIMVTALWDQENVYINSTVTINSSFSITNSLLLFGPNGKLEISGGYLYSSESIYFSCSSTGWPGIKVDIGGSLDFYDNRVEDAQIAVQIASNNAIRILNNYFNRNNVDIYVLNLAPNALLLGNIFDCTSATFTGNRSEAGIRLRKASLSVGSPTLSTSDRNTFIDHKRQIELFQGSTLNLHYANFSCANEYAIYSEYSNISLSAANNFALRNTFSNNRQDIRTKATNSNIEYSDFYNCLTDNILLTDNTNQEIIKIYKNNIFIDNNNTFAPLGKTGIILDRSSGGSGIFVFRNSIKENWITIEDFRNQASRRSAIKVKGFPGTSDYMEIVGNVIPANPGGSAPSQATNLTTQLIEINIGQAGGYIVRNNFIGTNNEDNGNYRNRWGFYLHDWESPSGANRLQANAVLGGSGTAFDYGLCAFHFLKSGPWTICGNTTDNTLRGFHIDDKCSTSDFAFNNIGHHERSVPSGTGQTAGLLMELDGELGAQSCRFNNWQINNYSPDYGAWHKSSTFFSASIFEFDPTQANTFPIPVTPVSGWFVPTTCPSPEIPCHTPLDPRDTLDGFVKKVITDNLTYKNPENVRSWEERKEILVQMLRNSALIHTSSESSLFYNTHIETSAGLFAQLSEMIHNAMSIDNTNKQALDQNYVKTNSVSAKIDSLDGTLTDSISIRHANSSFFSFRSTLLDQLKKLEDNKDSILQVIRSLQNNALQVCLVSNNTLPDTAIYENNQKFLNIITIKKALDLTITDEENAKLYSIIQQCPEKSGYTRNRAMNFLSLTDPDVSDFINCDEVNERTFSESPSMKFKVYPSPAQDILTIQFSSSFLGNIEIFNLSGIKVLQIKRQQIIDKLQFSVQNLPDGIYFLVCQSETGERFTSRLVITR